MSICLCMIVKDESHVIGTTLQNLYDSIPISYWVISDTGSTDTTKEIIQNFFIEKNIPGVLIDHEWKDFAYNRTQALQCAYQKTDYVFMFDADDSIIGKITIPKFKEDRYMARIGKDFSYLRPLFITNRKKWFYTGVLHEYLDSDEVRTTALLKGDYYIESGRTGSRNKNPNKYQDDAKVLEKAFVDEPRLDLKSRYAFYCAQSYKDAHQYEDAINWYKKCLDMNGWNQERCYACLQLGEMYSRQQKMELAQTYWCKSLQYDPERIEGIVMLVGYLQYQGNHVLVNALYHRWKDYNHHLEQKLFIRTNLYEYELEYFNSISAYYANDHSSGYSCCKKVILHHSNKDRVAQCIKHLVFYKPFLQKDKSFMDKLKNMNVPPFILK